MSDIPTPLGEAAAPAPHLPSRQPSRLRNIFMGKDGLRAGWSLLIFVAMLLTVALCARSVAHKIHPSTENTPEAMQNEMSKPSVLLLGEGIQFLAVLFVTWVMSWIERRPNSAYGLGGSHKLSYFFTGLGWGVVCLSLLVFCLWKTGLLIVDSRLLFGSNIVRYGAIWLLGFLLVALFEEYFTRGFVQYTLTRGFAGLYEWIFKTPHSRALGFWTAALLMSLLFGLGHGRNPGESPIGLLSAGLAGLVFCLSLWRTGSLWWAIGFHTAWDWSQSFLYGVADSGLMVQHHFLATHPVGKPILSGGTTGPEGSVYILAIFGVICLIILLTLRRASPPTAPASA